MAKVLRSGNSVHGAALHPSVIPHIWVDFRGIQDEYMRGKHSDYFENSRRATHAHRQYAIANPAVSRATANTAGGSRRVTPGARRPLASKERSDASLATKLAARPRVPTTGASLRGQSPPPCRSRPEIVAPALRYF